MELKNTFNWQLLITIAYVENMKSNEIDSF